MNSTINFYTQHADQFKDQYLSQPAKSVHASWQLFWSQLSHGQALDIGAGVGRDAKWLADKGLSVIAVEPSDGLRQLGIAMTKDLPVTWLNDTLPALENTIALGMSFDLILLSAVWMHIPTCQRQQSFRQLSSLLNPNGLLVISLRHGHSPDEREMYPVSVDELKQYAIDAQGLSLAHHAKDDDKLGRSAVYWETCVFIKK